MAKRISDTELKELVERINQTGDGKDIDIFLSIFEDEIEDGCEYVRSRSIKLRKGFSKEETLRDISNYLIEKIKEGKLQNKTYIKDCVKAMAKKEALNKVEPTIDLMGLLVYCLEPIPWIVTIKRYIDRESLAEIAIKVQSSEASVSRMLDKVKEIVSCVR